MVVVVVVAVRVLGVVRARLGCRAPVRHRSDRAGHVAQERRGPAVKRASASLYALQAAVSSEARRRRLRCVAPTAQGGAAGATSHKSLIARERSAAEDAGEDVRTFEAAPTERKRGRADCWRGFRGV